MRTGLLCYVLGCRDSNFLGQVRSVRHAAFGLVTACKAHDPNRFDVGQPLLGPLRATPAAAVFPVDAPAAEGGYRVLIVPTVPRVPPAAPGLVAPGLPAGARPF